MTKTKSKFAVKINTDMKRQSLKTGETMIALTTLAFSMCMYGDSLE